MPSKWTVGPFLLSGVSLRCCQGASQGAATANHAQNYRHKVWKDLTREQKLDSCTGFTPCLCSPERLP
jgi:hypothetical protein